jgi:hypothetical protein
VTKRDTEVGPSSTAGERLANRKRSKNRHALLSEVEEGLAVVATKPGEYPPGIRRDEGDAFVLTEQADFTESWMQRAELTDEQRDQLTQERDDEQAEYDRLHPATDAGGEE